MKQYIKAYLTTSAVAVLIYTIGYLIKTFVIFQFTNPFQWVIDIPTYKESTRLIIAFYYVLYLALKIFATIRLSKHYEIDDSINEAFNNAIQATDIYDSIKAYGKHIDAQMKENNK